MATFEDLDKEKIAELERLLRGKVNTFGKDGKVLNESFARSDKVAFNDILMHTPSANQPLVPPDYDDLPAPGTIGTRYEEVRLHSYLPSGLDGPNSIQTFMTVLLPPDSNNFSDVEAVRLKPLISPRYSQGKSNAASADPSFRGFELALYPAKSNGGVGFALVADTDKPISPVADPSAGPPNNVAPGVGTDGSWYVDYDNGVVRFSNPPLNGSNGIMNPNNVYGDINGIEDTDAYGAITMFATFYHYSGEFGTTANLSFLTVGDGYVSEGVFTGQNHNTVQSAVNSLPTNGGTVYIKEGTYDFTAPVVIPKNINIVGIGGVKIIRPPTTPAFVIYDGYNIIEGLEIQPRREPDGSVSTEGSIELRAASLNHIIKEVKIRNNVIYCDVDAYGIAFAPEFNCTYNGLHIYNNLFELVGDEAHGISERPAGGLAILQDSIIENNNFQNNSVSTFTYAINFFQHSLRNVEGLTIANNAMNGCRVIFRVSGSNDLVRFNYSNNSSDDVTIWSDRLDNSTISNNIMSNNSNFDIHANTIDTCVISDNIIDGDMNITTSTVSSTNINNLTVSGNTISNALFIQEPGDLFNTLIGSNTISDLYIPALNTSSVLSNHILGSLGIATSSPNVQALFVSNVSSNRTVTIDIGNAANANSFSLIEDSVINSNYMNSFTVYGMMESTSIVGNTVIVDMDFKNVGDSFNGCTISGNFTNGMTFTTLLDSVVSNNSMGGSMTLSSSTATSSVIDGNRLAGASINFSGTTLSGVVLSNNEVGSSVTLGTLTNSVVIGNYISSNLIIESVASGSNINDNRIGSLTIINTLTNSLFVDNFLNSSFTLEASGTGSKISDNFITGATSLVSTLVGDINGCEVNNNIFKSSVTVSRPFLDSKYMDGYVTGSTTFSERVTNSVISNNTLTAALTLSSITTNSIISDNIVGTTFTTGILLGSNVSNNILNGSYSFGAQLNSNLMSNKSNAAGEGIRFINSGRLYVSTGGAGKLATSTDGIDWTQRTSSFGGSDTINSVAYNGRDLWIAVGGQSAVAGKIATSPDGITWTQQTHDFGTSMIKSIAHDGKGLWVAGGELSGKISTSPDGIIWTPQVSGLGGSGTTYTVAHNKKDLWVVIADNPGNPFILTSPDGITWTSRVTSFGVNYPRSVAYNSRDMWVSGGTAGKMATSPDAINWTQISNSFAAGDTINSIAHNGKDLWVAVGGESGVSSKVATSPDGITWTQQTSVFGTDVINNVSYNGKDLWIIVANTGKMAISSDGVHWTLQTSSFSSTNIQAAFSLYGANAGLVGIGSQYNGTGVQGFGRGNLGIGVEGIGGDGYGVGGKFIGGISGGSGTESHGGPDGYGTYAIGGFPNGPGGHFVARGTGIGVSAISESGYGLLAQSDSTSPLKSALRVAPQNADPSFEPSKGDIYINDTTNRMRIYDGIGWSKLWTLVYANTADSNSITGSAEEDFNTQYTFAAGSVNQAGIVIRVKALIQMQWSGTQTVDFNLYLAGTKLTTTPLTFVFLDLVTDNAWVDVEYIIHVRGSNSVNTTARAFTSTEASTNNVRVSPPMATTPTLTGPALLKISADLTDAEVGTYISNMTIEVAG